MIGAWKAEGELTVAESGDVIKITENWKGSFDEQGRLIVEGQRMLGDNEQTFRWVYSFNSASELYELTYTDSNSEEEKTWQVSISEVESVVAGDGRRCGRDVEPTLIDGEFHHVRRPHQPRGEESGQHHHQAQRQPESELKAPLQPRWTKEHGVALDVDCDPQRLQWNREAGARAVVDDDSEVADVLRGGLLARGYRPSVRPLS